MVECEELSLSLGLLRMIYLETRAFLVLMISCMLLYAGPDDFLDIFFSCMLVNSGVNYGHSRPLGNHATHGSVQHTTHPLIAFGACY